MQFEEYKMRAMSNFLWDAFTDPAGVGVNIFDLLDGAAVAGVMLTPAQKDSVLNHRNSFGEWTSDDEEVRDAVAFATDHATYEQLFDWLACAVGDTTAADLVKEWEEEAHTILDKFDRENEAHTMTVKEWKETFAEELKETSDPDERDAIKETAALLDGYEEDELAINYVAADPVDFKILPYAATTREEQRLCRALGYNYYD